MLPAVCDCQTKIGFGCPARQGSSGGPHPGVQLPSARATARSNAGDHLFMAGARRRVTFPPIGKGDGLTDNAIRVTVSHTDAT